MLHVFFNGNNYETNRRSQHVHGHCERNDIVGCINILRALFNIVCCLNAYQLLIGLFAHIIMSFMENLGKHLSAH